MPAGSVSSSLSQNGSEMDMLPHLLAESEQPSTRSSASTATSASVSHRARKSQQLGAIGVEDLGRLE